MKNKTVVGTAACVWLALILVSVVYAVDVQVTRDSDFDFESRYWKLGGWNYAGANSSYTCSWQLGTAYLNVSNPDGAGWVGSKVQQGSLPHNWSQAPNLENEFTFTSSYKVFLEVKFKLGNWSFLHYPTQAPDNFSWFNFGVGFWFHKPNTDWNGNDSQLIVGAKLVWLRYDGQAVAKQTDDVYFQGDVGSDLHSLFDVYNENTTCHDWVTVKVDMTPYIQKALSHWKVSSPTLKCVEAYLETIGGKGEVWVDHVNVYAVLTSSNSQSPSLQDGLIYAFTPLILLFAGIMLFKGMMGR